ncbi:heavy metal transporter [Halalkalicoccus subterraneus]|uniref:heavy metal transporter n=1 Tax=Halalkalicoccus subterraneus TaxID=2675002 RepID=UPI000EFD4263|nr:heavy metal transporter [Halalkalicoccus subterraneus]
MSGMNCTGWEETVVESTSTDHEAGTVTADGEADREELGAAIADVGTNPQPIP